MPWAIKSHGNLYFSGYSSDDIVLWASESNAIHYDIQSDARRIAEFQLLPWEPTVVEVTE